MNHFQLNLIKICFSIALVMNSEVFQLKVQELLTFSAFFFNVVAYFYFRSYNNQATRLLNFACDLQLALSAMTLYLARVKVLEFSVVVAILFFIPISLQIGYILEQLFTSISAENTLGQGKNSNISPINLVHFTNRMLKGFDFSYNDYSRNPNSVILEEIIADHIQTCTKYPSCFCNFKDSTKEEYISNILDESKRRLFTHDFIRNTLRLNRSSSLRQFRQGHNNLNFTYCSFLLEVCDSKVQCLFELNQMVKSNSLSVREQMYSNYLLELIKSFFDGQDGNCLDFGVALNFEKKMDKTLILYEIALQNKFKFYNLLNNDHLDLQKLSLIGDTLLNQREQLRNSILELASINNQTPLFQILYEGFLEHLSFMESKNKLKRGKLKRDKDDQARQHKITSLEISGQLNKKTSNLTFTNNSKFFDIKERDLFSNDTCALFVRITGSELGKIVLAQRNFQEHFGFEMKEIINQPISIIIPSNIAAVHQNYLVNYINSVDEATSSQTPFYGKFLPLVIAQDKLGWGVPVSLRMQVEFLSELNELGLSCLIHIHKSESHFALIDALTFKIHTITRPLFLNVFSQIFSLKEIQYLNFARIIPAISYYIKEIQLKKYNNESESITTYGFLPQVNSDESLKFLKPLPEDHMNSMISSYSKSSTLSLYQIQMRLKLAVNEYQSVCIVEIESFKRLHTSNELRDGLQQCQIEFMNFFNAKFIGDSFQFDIQSISDKKQLDPYSFVYEKIAEQDHEEEGEIEVSFQNSHLALASKNNNSGNFEKEVYGQTFLGEKDNQDSTVLDERQIYESTNHAKVLPKINSKQRNLIAIGLEEARSDKNINILGNYSSRGNKAAEMSSTLLNSNRNIQQQESFFPLSPQNLDNIDGSVIVDPTERRNLISPRQFGPQQSGNLSNTPREKENILKIPENLQIKGTIASQIIENNHFTHNTTVKENSKLPNEFQDSSDNHVAKVSSFSKLKSYEIKHSEQKLKEDQPSLTSAHSYTSESKKAIYTKIESRKRGILEYILNGCGISSLIPLAVIIIVQYFVITRMLNQENIDFSLIPWPMSLRSEVGASMTNLINIKFADDNTFGGSPTAWAQFRSQSLLRINASTTVFTNLFLTFQNQNLDDRPYFQNVTSFDLNFVLLRDLASYKNSKVNRTITLQYFMIAFIFNVERLCNQIYSEYNEEGVTVENYTSFNTQFTALQASIQTSAAQRLTDIYSFSIMVIEVTLVLSFVITTVLIPAYYLIQSRIENILRLFATFQPAQIQQTLIILQKCLVSVASIKQSKSIFEKNYQQTSQKKQQQMNKMSQITFQQQSNFKRKNISTTTSIQKISIKIILFCAIAYSVIIVQPIVNVFLIESFNSQASINIEFLKTLFDMKAHFQSNCLVSYFLLYSVIVPTGVIYNPNYYKTRVGGLMALNTAKLTNLYSVVQRQTLVKRYQQSLYNDFLFKILSGNMCEALRDFPEFIDYSTFNFNYTECTTVQSSMLTSGFQVAAKYILEKFTQLDQILSMTDLTARQKSLQSWKNDYDFLDFDKFLHILIRVIVTMKNFLVNRNEDYMNYMTNILTVLLAFQCCSLALILYLGQIRFYSSLITNIHKSKQYLTLVSVNQLIENSYITSFLNKNQ